MHVVVVASRKYLVMLSHDVEMCAVSYYLQIHNRFQCRHWRRIYYDKICVEC